MSGQRRRIGHHISMVTTMPLAKVKVFFTELSTVGESAGLEDLLEQALQAAAAGQEPRWDSVGAKLWPVHMSLSKAMAARFEVGRSRLCVSGP